MMDAQADMAQPDAKQRLQASREALLHQLIPSTRPYGAPRTRLDSVKEALGKSPESPDSAERASHPDGAQQHSTLALLRRSLRAWWEFHPVRAVAEVAQPVVAEYAERRPWKLVGIAAGVGAAIVVTRPWRLVSVGGLAVAALRSPQVSRAALSMLSARRAAPQEKRKDSR